MNNNLKKKIFYISSLASVGFVLNSPEALANNVEGTIPSEQVASVQTSLLTTASQVAPLNVPSKSAPAADVTTQTVVAEINNVAKTKSESENLPLLNGQAQAEQNHTTLSKTVTAQSVESNNIINVQPLWEANVRGQGKVVAVIDTGLDVNHDVLRINDVSTAKFKSAADTEKAKAAAGISYGKWYNNKVIFGYNYADADGELKQKAIESHGMHVSGIAVGNPSQKHSSGNYIYGVAPEAQLMFMRVFSDKGAGGTSPFLYARAIEDAIKLGADTINLSLGSANGVLNDTSKTIEAAINKANAAGITVVIAAGNDTVFGEGHAKPDADKPDYGLVGDPAVAREGISVASFNNTHVTNELLTIKGTDDTSVIFSRPSIEPTSFDSTKEYEYVYAGKGTEAELEKLGDLSGKIVLIQRGDITFGAKVKNAHQYKAAGVVIFNNTEGDAHSVRMTLTEEEAKIPSLFIDRTSGELLIEKAKVGKHTILIDGKHGLYDNPKANEMSDFSSWGLSADGELKPDLAAPGGDIFSSVNDNRYATMGGTSMATPHVAGVSVLMKQVLENKYPEIKGKDQTTLIKHLLMSTAMPHVNKETNATTSPRQQGAGIINISKALASDLYVTGDEGLSSVSLGNVGDTFTFNVTLHNLSNTDKAVKYFTDVNTDQVKLGKVTLKPRKLTEVAGGNLTVKANSSTIVPITVDTREFTQELTESMKNGYYLEGFVRFLDTVDGGELVSIPYVGFKGEYQNLAVIEKPVYDFKDKENPFYVDLSKVKTFKQENDSHYTALLIGEKDFNHLTNEYTATTALTAGAFKDAKGNYVLRRDSEGKVIIAISPNNDGNRDALAFRGTFLRNYKDLKVAIYKADDTEFTTPLWLSEKASGDKNYYSGNPSNTKSNIIDTSEWTGKDSNGKLLPDGKYKYVVEHYSVVPGAEKQRLVFDVVLDTSAPKVKTGVYDGVTQTFKPRAVEEKGVGLYREEMYYVVEKSDNPLDSLIYTDPTRKEYIKKNEDGTYTIPSLDLYGRKISDESIWLVTEDFAGNTTRTNLADYKKIGNNSGLVNVRLMDKELNLSLSMLGYRYVIKDENGKVIKDDRQVGNTTHILPFGKYTVELILFDQEFAKILDTESIKTVTIDENNVEKVVDFDAKLVLYSTLTVDFNTELPEGLTVYAEDSNGNRTDLTKGRYIKDIFEKRLVYKEKYKIVVETPKGYFVAGNDVPADMVEDRVIKVLSLWAKGDMTSQGVSLERDSLKEFNLSEDSDNDGFTNEVELLTGSNPLVNTSVPNVKEKGKSLTTEDTRQEVDLEVDTDGDGFTNKVELENNSNPFDAKSVPKVWQKSEPILLEKLAEAATPLITEKGTSVLVSAKPEVNLQQVSPNTEVSPIQTQSALFVDDRQELLQSNSRISIQPVFVSEKSEPTRKITPVNDVTKVSSQRQTNVLPKTSAVTGKESVKESLLLALIILVCFLAVRRKNI